MLLQYLRLRVDSRDSLPGGIGLGTMARVGATKTRELHSLSQGSGWYAGYSSWGAP